MVQMKRTAALLLTATLLCGCQKTPPAPTTEPTTAPTTVQTEPTTLPTTPTEPTEEIIPPIAEPPAPDNPQILAPVTKLTCTKWVAGEQWCAGTRVSGPSSAADNSQVIHPPGG